MQAETIVLAGGCFWGTQRVLKLIPGVLRTEVGYANGPAQVGYETVRSGMTNCAEAVRLTFDAQKPGLARLIELFFSTIDPTRTDGQGGDIGRQYRSGVYYLSETQRPAIEKGLACVQKAYTAPLAVEIAPLSAFCRAEDMHQDYLEKNPGGYCHIGPMQLIRLAARLRELEEP